MGDFYDPFTFFANWPIYQQLRVLNDFELPGFYQPIKDTAVSLLVLHTFIAGHAQI